MKEEFERSEHLRKSAEYESLLWELNERLAVTSAVFERDAPEPRLPLLFIVGPPRSGTTLLYQVLAAAGDFAYCTNLIARFPLAPAIGARIQKLLAPLIGPRQISFRSFAGTTVGWGEPHEFGYFWEHHLRFESHHQPTPSELSRVDVALLLRRLGAFEAVEQKPLLFKNVLLDFVLPWLAERLPTARFVRIRRPALELAQSIYRMRLEYYGRPDAWLSVRPRDGSLLTENPPRQIAAQLASIERALDDAAESIRPGRWTELEYADVCRDPRQVVLQLRRVLGVSSAAPVADVPERFPYATWSPLDAELVSELRSALREAGLRA